MSTAVAFVAGSLLVWSGSVLIGVGAVSAMGVLLDRKSHLAHPHHAMLAAALLSTVGLVVASTGWRML